MNPRFQSDKRVIVIDQTIREGMQYRGLVFSLEERKQILAFQEKLGIDVSQAAYPPAHFTEVLYLKHLREVISDRGYHIRVAGLCRAVQNDVAWMVESKMSDFHLHSGISKDMLNRFGADEIFRELGETVRFIKNAAPCPCIHLAFADVGQTDMKRLTEFVDYAVCRLQVDVVNLPDTSGTMAPHVYHHVIRQLALRVKDRPARIAVHCHNDLGMANANTVMGIIAGASVVEACALGIGERNGIADLYTVCRVLQDQGYEIRAKTEDRDGFKAYYDYIHALCVEKTGFGPFNYNTPVFGEAVRTHVAGTHDVIHYGMAQEKRYFLNVLCGKHLVANYLHQCGIAFDPLHIQQIVKKIKDQSASENRGLNQTDVRLIVDEISRGHKAAGG